MIATFNNLLEMVARALGAVAIPLLAPWKARREGQAKIIAAQADARVLEIWTRARVKAHDIARKNRESECSDIATSRFWKR